ncbi:DUF499 domain-containing protein [Sinorhizobium meliloti]|uniref:DUF499 domain-containing protein n=1 Tax=Rhizobium meliloti TaxID=382 RepID=UPI001295E132|nr:DUF499 domain-containing protein [Sinorhizobium meliloti]MDW9593795.1 DUF499 domain-containing protein [Sinorhizobium meliloti]MDX0188867.1 DUF499 domain-containing protein [Sinorhizobium meliloti]MQV10079.1 DUF499 domain-containing protein [Sinorhizobium meliloti]
MNNRDRIAQLLALIERGCLPFVETALKSGFGAQWRQTARLPKSLSPVADLDAYALLYAIIHNWRDVFENSLKPEMRDAASAALAGRNKHSHSSSEIDNQLTLRALSGGADLLNAVGAKDEAGKASALLNGLLTAMTGVTAAANAKPAGSLAAGTEPARRPTLTLTSTRARTEEPRQEDFFGGGEVEGLKPWRVVSPPREDVLTGRLDKDKFAANLAAADREEGEDTYADPIEFFNATYLTAGLRMTLENAAKRLTGGGGPSTIGLQTNFGGGKTHTLLSLLHMTRLQDLSRADNLSSIAAAVSASSLGEVNLAVFSGSDKGPDVPLAMADGHAIRTLWGYLAWRIAGRDGLALVQSSENAGTSPGGEVFQKVLALNGKPSLILLDELVVFVRQLVGERYNAHISFLQSLTEAAAQIPNALIVGSLPESDLEAGGTDKGRETLHTLEKLFGRTQSAWQPAQGSETYSVVRRRLFQELDTEGEKQRRRTVDRFIKLYRDHKSDFPSGTGERDYADKIMEAYPIHPMLFDKLSTEWGALEKFQRTRGVLALLARTIFASYRERSDEPLILPSSLRVDDPAVRGALLEPLSGPVWGSIIEGEVDGDTSLPAEMEARRQRYRNDQVARRAARAVFVSTAPAGDARGGITGPELRLACVKPGEQISIFGDALREIAERSAHLYEAEGRYWYGPRATLNKLADNRQLDVDDDAADAEIIKFLKTDERARSNWGRVHTAPDRASEVEDRPTSGLVILGPSHVYQPGGGSLAEVEAMDGLDRRSGGQRKYRNALVFLAADERGLEDARRTVKRMMAWKSIVDDLSLDLTDSQKSDAQNRFAQAEKAAKDTVRKAWSHLLVPTPSPSDHSVVVLEHFGMRLGAQRTPAEAAWDKASEVAVIATTLGRQSFTERMLELWPQGKPDLPVDQVRDWYFEFLHMERLRDEVVLAGAISDAVADMDPARAKFALAAGKAAEAYQELQFSKSVPVRFGQNMLIVLRDVAEAAKKEDQAGEGGDTSRATAGGATIQGASGSTDTVIQHVRPKRFSGMIELDTIRGAMKVSQVFESVIAELDRAEGTTFRIVLEVQAECSEGFPSDVEGDVTANAGALGFMRKQFDRN